MWLLSLRNFDFLYGVMLGEIVLRLADNLSRTLQQKTLSAAEGNKAAMLTCDTLVALRSDNEFDKFWDSVKQKHMKLALMNQFFHENAGLQQGLRKDIVILIILCLPLICTGPYTLKP